MVRGAGIGRRLVVCACAGAPTDWADVEGRIQYAYYTNDARALNGVLASLKPKAVEGEEEARAAMRRPRARISARSRTTGSRRC